jgi:hypothetical protein
VTLCLALRSILRGFSFPYVSITLDRCTPCIVIFVPLDPCFNALYRLSMLLVYQTAYRGLLNIFTPIPFTPRPSLSLGPGGITFG